MKKTPRIYEFKRTSISSPPSDNTSTTSSGDRIEMKTISSTSSSTDEEGVDNIIKMANTNKKNSPSIRTIVDGTLSPSLSPSASGEVATGEVATACTDACTTACTDACVAGCVAGCAAFRESLRGETTPSKSKERTGSSTSKSSRLCRRCWKRERSFDVDAPSSSDEEEEERKPPREKSATV